MLILPGAVVGVVVSFWDQQPRADSRFEQFEGYAAASMQSPNATDDHRADGGGHSRVEQGCLPAGEGRRGLRCGDGKVGYIHVGKTGGTTVVGYLTASSIGFTEYHTGGAPSLDDIRSHPRWLISVRDPIERLKSCFDWQNPQGGGGYKAGEWADRFYRSKARPQGCFADFGEFVEALGRKRNDSCAELARFTISTEAASPASGRDNDGSRHFAKGLKWYVTKGGKQEEVFEALLQADLRMIATENLQEDLLQVGGWLGRGVVDTSGVGHARRGVRHGMGLSKSQHDCVREALREEYELLARLKRVAGYDEGDSSEAGSSWWVGSDPGWRSEKQEGERELDDEIASWVLFNGRQLKAAERHRWAELMPSPSPSPAPA